MSLIQKHNEALKTLVADLKSGVLHKEHLDQDVLNQLTQLLFPTMTIEKVIEIYTDIDTIASDKKEAEKLRKEFFKNFTQEYLIIEK